MRGVAQNAENGRIAEGTVKARPVRHDARVLRAFVQNDRRTIRVHRGWIVETVHLRPGNMKRACPGPGYRAGTGHQSHRRARTRRKGSGEIQQPHRFACFESDQPGFSVPIYGFGPAAHIIVGVVVEAIVGTRMVGRAGATGQGLASDTERRASHGAGPVGPAFRFSCTKLQAPPPLARGCCSSTADCLAGQCASPPREWLPAEAGDERPCPACLVGPRRSLAGAIRECRCQF